MKKLNTKISILFAVLSVFIYQGCDTPEPIACFSYTPSIEIKAGDIVTFTNCSENADIYEWNFGDGTTSIAANPEHIYTEANNYKVTLIAQNESKSNQKEITITVAAAEIILDHPTNYDLPINWFNHYVNEFTTDGEWPEETTSDYTLSISNGVYSMTSFDTVNTWFFWTNSKEMPAENEDFDYEIYYKIDDDSLNQGSGIFSSLIETSFDFYFFLLTPYKGTSFYTFGNKNNNPWDEEFTGTGGIVGDYNKLTIRKYKNTLYYFINEVYMNSTPFEGNYGQKFGFILGADSKITTDWISIWKMDLSATVNASEKSVTKADREKNLKNSKEGSTQKRSIQTGIQAKKIPGKMPVFK
ncbi:MAG: PKD domain-containing protein [Salinivirgaceae bacterium]